MNNELEFLAAVRDALKGAERAGAPELFHSRPEGEQAELLERGKRKKAERLELLELLKERAVPLNMKMHEAASFEEAGDIVADIARNADTEWGGDKRIVTHDNPVLEKLGLAGRLAEDAIPVNVARLEEGEDEMVGKQRLREMAIASYIGVTGADYGVADCAAIALMTGPGRGRTVSLVPSIHIAVLELKNLLRDLPELYALLEKDKPLPTSFNFISGPSKTADIEAQLVHGAHGPRAMHLVVVTSYR